MMKLNCKDINPQIACTFEATGETAKEVAEKMMVHVKMEHADDLVKMNMSDEQMMAMLEGKAHG